MSGPACNLETIHPGGAQPLGVRVYRGAPPGVVAVPLVLHLHGGAFVAGAPETGSVVAELLAEAEAVVVSLDYPLAPTHPFPQALEAAYATLDWMQRHARRLAGARTRLFVAGEEAGGNLAAALSLMARDRDSPRLAGQLLLSPMLDACVATASLRGSQAGPVGCPFADGWRKYLQRASDALHPYATPGQSMRLTGLPRTLLLTARDDPMRDETLDYGRRLRAAGVPVDDAVLPFATGWPHTYRQAAQHATAWASEVRDQARRFFDLCGART
jgi:acetyl esterase/lipase